MASSTALETMANPKAAKGFLEHNLESISKNLTRSLNPDMFIRVALSAMSRNPLLFDCTRASVIRSLLECGQLGLMPNSHLGLAYLVPFRNRQLGGAWEAQFIPGYRGLIELARRTGEVKHVQPRSVYKGDVFEVEFGYEERIVHRPNLDAPRGWDDLLYVYSVATFADGFRNFDVMTKAEVVKVRARSKSSDRGPWVTDTEAMSWKTVVRRHAKLLPQNPDLERGLEADARLDGGDVFADIGAGAAEAPAPPTRTEQVRDRIRVHTQRNGAPAAAAEEAEWEDVTPGAGPAAEPWEPGDDLPPFDGAPVGAPPAGADPVLAFTGALFARGPSGGDATKGVRGKIEDAAVGLKDAGRIDADEYERARWMAKHEDLGKAQAEELARLGTEALQALPAAAPAGGDGLFGGEG